MPTVMRPMPAQESSQVRSAQRERSYESLGSPANPSAATSSRPYESVIRLRIDGPLRGGPRPKGACNFQPCLLDHGDIRNQEGDLRHWDFKEVSCWLRLRARRPPRDFL